MRDAVARGVCRIVHLPVRPDPVSQCCNHKPRLAYGDLAGGQPALRRSKTTPTLCEQSLPHPLIVDCVGEGYSLWRARKSGCASFVVVVVVFFWGRMRKELLTLNFLTVLKNVKVPAPVLLWLSRN